MFYYSVDITKTGWNSFILKNVSVTFSYSGLKKILCYYYFLSLLWHRRTSYIYSHSHSTFYLFLSTETSFEKMYLLDFCRNNGCLYWGKANFRRALETCWASFLFNDVTILHKPLVLKQLFTTNQNWIWNKYNLDYL